MKFPRNAAFAIMLAASIALTGCYGKFGLTREVYKLNGQITDNKFVHSLMMVVMMVVPVYEFAGLADIIVLNPLEFWTGKNPIDASLETIQHADGSIELRRVGESISARQLDVDTVEISRNGALLGRATARDDGTIVVADVDGATVRTIAVDEYLSLNAQAGSLPVSLP